MGGQPYPLLLPDTAQAGEWCPSPALGLGAVGKRKERLSPAGCTLGGVPKQATFTACLRGQGFPESLQPQTPLPPWVEQGSQDARHDWPLAMTTVGHISCQSHHHGHIETGAHGNGECGQEEGPARGGAGQAEVPLGDGLAGLGREMC